MKGVKAHVPKNVLSVEDMSVSHRVLVVVNYYEIIWGRNVIIIILFLYRCVCAPAS